MKPFVKDLKSIFEEDKRSATRLKMDMPILYRTDTHLEHWRVAQSVNVSQNGIRISTRHAVLTGSKIQLRFTLPGETHIFQMEARVIWTKPVLGRGDLLECGLIFEHVKDLSHQEKMIRFFADEICTLALKYPNEFEIRPARSLEELKEAYRLIYREYQKRTYCQEKSEKMHYNYFSFLPQTRTFILKQKKEELIGTISLIPDSPLGLSMESLFPDEINQFRSEGKKMAEVSLLSLSRERGFSLANLRKLSTTFNLFRYLLRYAEKAGVTDLVIAVHPKHESLYRYWDFDVIGPVKSYEGACGNPALPMRMNISQFFKDNQDKPLGTYCHLLPASELNRGHFVWKSDQIQEFLEPLLKSMSQEAKAYIQSLYPLD